MKIKSISLTLWPFVHWFKWGLTFEYNGDWVDLRGYCYGPICVWIERI